MTEKKTESSHELRPHHYNRHGDTGIIRVEREEEEEEEEEFQSYSYSMARDTIEGPRAPAVKLTARHSSLTRVRAAPLSPW